MAGECISVNASYWLGLGWDRVDWERWLLFSCPACVSFWEQLVGLSAIRDAGRDGISSIRLSTACRMLLRSINVSGSHQSSIMCNEDVAETQRCST